MNNSLTSTVDTTVTLRTGCEWQVRRVVGCCPTRRSQYAMFWGERVHVGCLRSMSAVRFLGWVAGWRLRESERIFFCSLMQGWYVLGSHSHPPPRLESYKLYRQSMTSCYESVMLNACMYLVSTFLTWVQLQTPSKNFAKGSNSCPQKDKFNRFLKMLLEVLCECKPSGYDIGSWGAHGQALAVNKF